jgi:hypothetical protein
LSTVIFQALFLGFEILFLIMTGNPRVSDDPIFLGSLLPMF